MNRKPIKVELVACTPNPIELVFATEKFAKTDVDNPVLTDVETISQIRSLVKEDYPPIAIEDRVIYEKTVLTWLQEAGYQNVIDYVADVENWAMKVIGMAIPIAETIQFSFRLTNVTIAFREQLVRHRDGSFWIQSGRITDYSKIFNNKHFNTPQGVIDAGLEDRWDAFWKIAQDFYEDMKDSGVKDQDAREIVGTGAFHRLTLTFNLRRLLRLITQRLCWIAQLGHWGPVVSGICEELQKIDPIFSQMSQPPCMSNGKYKACQYEAMARERYEGKDPLPVCPMWFAHIPEEDHPRLTKACLNDKGRWDEERVKMFMKMWGKK